MTSLAVGDWLILISLGSVLFGGLIATIKGMLKDQWTDHKELHKVMSEKMDNHTESIQGLEIQVKGIETICNLRQSQKAN